MTGIASVVRIFKATIGWLHQCDVLPPKRVRGGTTGYGAP